MTDNLLIGPDAQARFALQMLRAHDGKGTIAGEITTLAEGSFLSVDPEGQVKGSFKSSRKDVVSLKMTAPRSSPPRWQALHVVMGAADLTDAAAVGLMARTRAPQALATRVCLRSGRDGQMLDSFLDKQIVSYSEPSTHLDLLDLSRRTEIPRRADWREMILFFRPGPVEIDILDLRLFIV